MSEVDIERDRVRYRKRVCVCVCVRKRERVREVDIEGRRLKCEHNFSSLTTLSLEFFHMRLYFFALDHHHSPQSYFPERIVLSKGQSS